ncbi:FAD-dependent oxidoreductase [Paenibacillus sp. GCM10023252]|uniref:FAD-dependent oxidoreductase n=1 Tax=Paenibacillus sp. GCM10023252 TaxID=3252649 RepID=UPI00361C238B
MQSKDYEVIIYGGTPGGIGAAIAAARQDRRTLLLEPSSHIGGLMTSGLGRKFTKFPTG